MSEVLRISSALYSLVQILVLFMFFYAPRYSAKKSAIITAATMLPLILVNILILVFAGQEVYGKLVVFIIVLPSFLFFLWLSKYRDFRFVFTFCLVDTISSEIIILSMILNWYFTPGSNILMFIIRIFGFLGIEILAVKKLRKSYFEMQERIKKGWGMFSLVSVIFYVLVVSMIVYPTLIYERPEDMPMIMIFMILMPLMYINIFQILANQNRLHEAERAKELWQIQQVYMQRQIDQYDELDKRISFERHNLRHKFSIIDVMLQKGETDEARKYISMTIDESLASPDGERYCQNPVLDAVFTHYFNIAKDKGISIIHQLKIEDALPVPEQELAIVIANGLENAIKACEAMPPEQRFIRCKCIDVPQFMLQISNAFNGTVVLDEKGVPVSDEKGHGIGTRSILAFCEKYGAAFDYKIENGVFALRIVVQKDL